MGMVNLYEEKRGSEEQLLVLESFICSFKMEFSM